MNSAIYMKYQYVYTKNAFRCESFSDIIYEKDPCVI